jgi:hypothetical protein
MTDVFCRQDTDELVGGEEEKGISGFDRESGGELSATGFAAILMSQQRT